MPLDTLAFPSVPALCPRPGPWPDAATARRANLQKTCAANKMQGKQEGTKSDREREREREANNYNKTRRLGACVGGFSPVALSSYCRAPRHTGTSVSIPHTHTSVKPHGRHLHMDLPKAFFPDIHLVGFREFSNFASGKLGRGRAPPTATSRLGRRATKCETPGAL